MKEIKNNRLTIAIIITFIAMLVHVYLTKEYYAIHFGFKTGQSLCNVNSTFNCDAVSASRFSSFLNIPMALWGFVTNLILLCLIALPRFFQFESRERVYRYGLYVSLLTVLASLAMGAISLIFLHNYCLFCILAYVLSITGFAFIWSASDYGLSELGSDIAAGFSEQKWLLFFAFPAIPALAFVFQIVILQNFNATDLDKYVDEKVAQWQNGPQYNFSETGLIDNPNATKWTLVEYADFLCPHCKHAYPTFHAFAAANPDVKMIFKAFPLDGSCNPTSPSKGDGVRCELAFMVFCADKIGQKGFAFHDAVFDKQEELATGYKVETLLAELAAKHSIDSEQLKSCMASEETLTLIQNMAKEAEAAKLGGTPTVYLNGRYLPSGQMLKVLQKAISTK